MTQHPQGDPTQPNYPPIDTTGNSGYQQAGSSPYVPPQQPGDTASAGQGGFSNAVGSIGGTGPMTAQQERSWGMLAHVIPLVLFVLSAGTLGFVASLVIYLMYKDRGPFVRENAANSLNIQIATGIGLVISAILMFVLVGFITYPLVCLWAIVLHAIAASKANQGEWYSPPMVPKFIR
ncbi:MAG: DUF4870 domain-containing protein [Tetrasphaera sp.]